MSVTSVASLPSPTSRRTHLSAGAVRIRHRWGKQYCPHTVYFRVPFTLRMRLLPSVKCLTNPLLVHFAVLSPWGILAGVQDTKHGGVCLSSKLSIPVFVGNSKWKPGRISHVVPYCCDITSGQIHIFPGNHVPRNTCHWHCCQCVSQGTKMETFHPGELPRAPVVSHWHSITCKILPDLPFLVAVRKNLGQKAWLWG